MGMNHADNLIKAKSATQYIFLICGIALSTWAIMVPFVKERLHLNDARLGMLMLLLGVGAMLTMPITGIFIQRLGSRKTIFLFVLVISCALPLLSIMTSEYALGINLLVFGGALGGMDVAMNTHGANVQNAYERPIMSSLHGWFSVGGLLGALSLGFFIKTGFSPIAAVFGISILLMTVVFKQYGHLLTEENENQIKASFNEAHSIKVKGSFQWLNKRVFFLGVMCFMVFMSEGAILDWGSILLNEYQGVDKEWAGLGFATFSVAIAIMRLMGDRLVARYHPEKVVIYGSSLAAIGFLTTLTPYLSLSLCGFALIGIGVANLVPIFFSEGGRLINVPAAIAMPAITSFGYAGQLMGPALLGYIAAWMTLTVAFGGIALLLSVVAIAYFLKRLYK